MATTAVGLFETPSSVDKVVGELEASGFPQNDVRVLGEPGEMTGSGVISTPHTDFELDLIRDLRDFGANEADAEAYIRGMRRGGVISGAVADDAAAIMNQHCAVEIEELSASQSYLPGADNEELAQDRDVSFQAGRVRSSGSGARLFVW